MTLLAAQGPVPEWLPDFARLYLRHVEGGVSIRALARAEGCHASTVLRRVRRIEERRDDPLIDEALSLFGTLPPAFFATGPRKESSSMTAPIRACKAAPPDDRIEAEARRILRRLAEPDSILVVSPEMEKAVVMRAAARVAVTDRAMARAFALKDWIQLRHSGRVSGYEITASGRAFVKEILEEERALLGGDGADDPDPAERRRVWGARDVSEGAGRVRRMRVNLAESPLAMLARRRDEDGKPFLPPDLVAAGERLREDFELAQMGPRVAQNWERFLTGGDRGSFHSGNNTGGGAERAHRRVAAALTDLGPGLGDMALRCCCFLEGLETAEKRLGWSARSGKIVLRIALMRLKRHYDEAYAGKTPLIG